MNLINERVFDLLDVNGLNWTAKKVQLIPSIEGMEQPQSFGMYRSDCGKHLGTVGNKYQPIQNSKLAEIFLSALDRIGMSKAQTKAGHLAGGKKVFFQAALKDEHVAKDTVKRYITSLNSHDGSTGAAFGASNTVVICQNSFYKALKSMSKARHTASIVNSIELQAENLIRAIEGESQVIETYKKLANEPIMPETLNGLFKELFGTGLETKTASLSTRKKNQMVSVANVIHSEIESHGQSLWGLFNGITYYTNHIARGKQSKLEYVMSKQGYKTNGKAFDFLENQVATALN